ncbi:MAG: NTPase [bacterium]
MKILITGRPGVGKTTFVKRLLDELSIADICGFWTDEIRENGVRIGFRIITVDGREGILAMKGINKLPMVGSYSIYVDEIERLIVPEIEKAIRDRKICIIDEIGSMELKSARFRKVINDVFNSNVKLIATVKLKRDSYLENLMSKEDISVYVLTENNRAKLLGELRLLIRSSFL